MPKVSILNDKNAVESAVSESSSMKEVLSKLGLRAAGGNYAALKRACEKHNIILPQWNRDCQVRLLGRQNRIPDEDVFVQNSTYSNRTRIKERLRKYRDFICDECGLGELWNGKPITLQLEHINGIHNDNRLSNLSILCPNCHSQTETYAGKNSVRLPTPA